MLSKLLSIRISLPSLATAALVAAVCLPTSSLMAQQVAMQNKLSPSGFTINEQPSPEVAEIYDFYQTNFKFVPNLAKIMSGSPALMRSYFETQKNLKEHGTLSQAELNVVQMAIAVENKCRYCTAGHTMVGKMLYKTPEEHMEAVRQRKALNDPKLNVLRNFALHLYNGKGHVPEMEMQKFLAAGYTREQSLDVVACVAAKVMSNYANALGKTEIDAPMKPLAVGLNF